MASLVLIDQVTEHQTVHLLVAEDLSMIQFCITTTPSGRVFVSMFLPEGVVEGYPLGTLIKKDVVSRAMPDF